MEKIYSRPKIKLPKFFGQPTRQKMWLFFWVLLVIAMVSFGKAVYAIFVATCQTAAGSKANHMIHTEVAEIMQEYSYDDLITTEKDSSRQNYTYEI